MDGLVLDLFTTTPTKGPDSTNVDNITKTYFSVVHDKTESFWVSYCKAVAQRRIHTYRKLSSPAIRNLTR